MDWNGRRWWMLDVPFRKGSDRRNWPWTFGDWGVWSSWGWSTRRSCGKWLVTGRRWRLPWRCLEAQRPMARYSTAEWTSSDPRCSWHRRHFRVVVAAAVVVASVSTQWPAWISGPVSCSHPAFHWSRFCYDAFQFIFKQLTISIGLGFFQLFFFRFQTVNDGYY